MIGGITKNTLNSVAQVLCGQQVSGQPAAVVNTGSIQAEFLVEELSKMAGRSIKTEGGSFDLPPAEDLFPHLKSGNLRQKVSQLKLITDVSLVAFSIFN